SRQALVEVHRVPGVNGFLGDGEGGGTQLLQAIQATSNGGFKLIGGDGRLICEANRSSLGSGYRSSCENQFGGVFLSDQCRERSSSDRRITGELDLRESPL